jgi:hypothetical protein
MLGSLPGPKCRRVSLVELQLPPAWTSSICVNLDVLTRTRAPTAERLLAVPMSRKNTRWFAFFVSFRNTDGGAPALKTVRSDGHKTRNGPVSGPEPTGPILVPWWRLSGTLLAT